MGKGKVLLHNSKASDGGGTFYDPNCSLRKKEPKNVLGRRLCREKKLREVMIVRACRGERGFTGHLLHVERGFKTHRNLKVIGSKA